MNERIKELWDQAQEEIKAEYEDESRRNRRLYNEIFLPKFAELIVRDIHQYVDSMDTAQIISNGILRRYGVEL
tara:strand:+ start:121 stop:339 length:219 start_codon:yes stop_codon:yes gene_type:complete